MFIKSLKLVSVISCLAFLSCEKKELPAPTYDRGDVITAQVEMTSNYKNQIWYRLSDNQVVSTNFKTDWDLAFEASVDGFHIALNTGKAMKAYKTNFQNLSQVTDTTGLGSNGKPDVGTGNMDSTGIGDWKTDNAVYVIHRGYNESGQLQGFFKLKILTASGTQFTFEYGDIFGTTTYQGTVNKNADFNFKMFSFTTNQAVEIEPKKSDYDLCFTQYTHVFTNPFQYYQVTGVLNNTYKTRIAKVNDKTFNTITLSDTLGRTFSGAQNAIGYDWKSFDLNTNIYSIDLTKCFIINDSKGFYYKLHFVDFYSSTGLKGYPKFEFKKL